MGIRFGCMHDLIAYCKAAGLGESMALAVRDQARGMGLHWGDDWSDALRSLVHNGKLAAQKIASCDKS